MKEESTGLDHMKIIKSFIEEFGGLEQVQKDSTDIVSGLDDVMGELQEKLGDGYNPASIIMALASGLAKVIASAPSSKARLSSMLLIMEILGADIRTGEIEEDEETLH